MSSNNGIDFINKEKWKQNKFYNCNINFIKAYRRFLVRRPAKKLPPPGRDQQDLKLAKNQIFLINIKHFPN